MSTTIALPESSPAAAVIPQVGWKPRHNPWAIALTVTLATFMEVLDTSIANVALPHISGNLSAGQDESTWVLTSYLVANAVVLPISAWLAGLVGRKRFYMSCVVLFGISSFLCGLAPSLGWLVFFRVLQGLGGGGLAPSEQSILADTFPPAKRGMAFAVYGFAVVLAPAIGPTLGGFITDNYSWRWIFFINIPVAILSLLLTARLVEDPPYLKKKKSKDFRIDYVGLGLITLGLGALQVVLDKGEREDWLQSDFIRIFAVLTVVGIVGGVIWAYFQKNPVIDVHLFANRNLGISCMMMFMLGLTLFGTTVLLPQLLQNLMGYTAVLSGEILSPGGIAILILLPLVGFMVSKVDARYMIAFGFLVSSLALLHMTGLNLEMSFGAAVRLRVYQAMGLAFLFVPINTMSYVGIPMEKNNSVSAMTNLFRNVGGSVGISLVETLLAQRSQFHQTVLANHDSDYSPAYRNSVEALSRLFQQGGKSATEALNLAHAQLYMSIQRQAAVLAYIDTIKVFAVVCAIMVPLAFLMRRNKEKAHIAAH